MTSSVIAPNNHLTSFSDHLTAQYGECGTTREEFEEGFEAFKFEAMLQAAQRKRPDPGTARREMWHDPNGHLAHRK